MATFREFLILEAKKEETEYDDMKVKSDKDLADAAEKIEIRKNKREKGKEVTKELRNRRNK